MSSLGKASEKTVDNYWQLTKRPKPGAKSGFVSSPDTISWLINNDRSSGKKELQSESNVNMMHGFLLAFNLTCEYLWNPVFISRVFSEIYVIQI